MRIRNASIPEVHSVLATLRNDYGYAIEYKSGPIMVTKNTVSVALRSLTSDSFGARRSWTGRRGPWACWHVYRDFSREMFELQPDAVISTMLARYTADDFEDLYPETDYDLSTDRYFSDLCWCAGGHGA